MPSIDRRGSAVPYPGKMDTYLTIASRREVRDYADRPLAADVVVRILDAGRVTGSAKNRQPWKFVVVRDEGVLERLGTVVTRPSNLAGAPLAVAIVLDEGASPFDAGRAAQAMMLAAWNEGVGSCPNSIKDKAAFQRIVGINGDAATLLTFGYPERAPSPVRRPADEWIESADRKPRADVVVEVG